MVYDIEKPTSQIKSRSNDAFDYIQSKIITEDYAPGYQLNEVEIAEVLGLSRTPVREAIKQLANDGLVKLELNRGAIVLGLTKEDMENILLIRSFLEGLCAKWAAVRFTDDQINTLQETVDIQQFYCDRGNLQQCWQVGRAFHAIIYQNCGSRQVINLLETFHNYIYLRLEKKLISENNKHPATALSEHIDIVNAIKEHDPELSEKLMSAHLRSTKYSL